MKLMTLPPARTDEPQTAFNPADVLIIQQMFDETLRRPYTVVILKTPTQPVKVATNLPFEAVVSKINEALNEPR